MNQLDMKYSNELLNAAFPGADERVEARGFKAVEELLSSITAKADAIDDGSCAAANRADEATSDVDAQRHEVNSNKLHDIHNAALAFHDEVMRILRGTN